MCPQAQAQTIKARVAAGQGPKNSKTFRTTSAVNSTCLNASARPSETTQLVGAVGVISCGSLAGSLSNSDQGGDQPCYLPKTGLLVAKRAAVSCSNIATCLLGTQGKDAFKTCRHWVTNPGGRAFWDPEMAFPLYIQAYRTRREAEVANAMRLTRRDLAAEHRQ